MSTGRKCPLASRHFDLATLWGQTLKCEIIPIALTPSSKDLTFQGLTPEFLLPRKISTTSPNSLNSTPFGQSSAISFSILLIGLVIVISYGLAFYFSLFSQPFSELF
jgi:hypothetical protein